MQKLRYRLPCLPLLSFAKLRLLQLSDQLLACCAALLPMLRCSAVPSPRRVVLERRSGARTCFEVVARGAERRYGLGAVVRPQRPGVFLVRRCRRAREAHVSSLSALLGVRGVASCTMRARRRHAAKTGDDRSGVSAGARDDPRIPGRPHARTSSPRAARVCTSSGSVQVSCAPSLVVRSRRARLPIRIPRHAQPGGEDDLPSPSLVEGTGRRHLARGAYAHSPRCVRRCPVQGRGGGDMRRRDGIAVRE
jgi:hypothetical protein